MTEKLEQKLFNRFSFFHPEKPPQESLICFGIECSDGWFGIIWDLCEAIDEEIKKHKIAPEDNTNTPILEFEVIQVKEKFGGLRFYTNFMSEKIDDLIQEAEEKSYKTCEICGAPGETRGSGWVQTLCDKHYNEDSTIS